MFFRIGVSPTDKKREEGEEGILHRLQKGSQDEGGGRDDICRL